MEPDEYVKNLNDADLIKQLKANKVDFGPITGKTLIEWKREFFLKEQNEIYCNLRIQSFSKISRFNIVELSNSFDGVDPCVTCIIIT